MAGKRAKLSGDGDKDLQIRELKHRVKQLSQALDRAEKSAKTVSSELFEYKSVFEQTLALNAVIGMDFDVIDINSRFVESLGYAKEDMVGKKVIDFIADSDIEKAVVMIRHALEGIVTPQVEIGVVGKDGIHTIMFAPGHVSVRRSDEIVGVMVSGVDISEYKRAEAELKRSEKRFRETFEQAAVGMAHIAPYGEFLRINQRFCDIVGYSRPELLKLTFQDITHPDDLEEDLANVRRVLAGEINTYSMEKRYCRKDGSIVWVNLTVALYRETDGRPDYFISVIEDITDRKRAEEALRESENRYRALVETVREGIGIVDDDENILFVNSAFTRMLGYRIDELVDHNLKEFTAQGEFAKLKDQTRRRLKGESSRYETVLYTKKGEARMFSVSATPLADEKGEFIGTLGVVSDITDRKRTEQALKETKDWLQHIIDNSWDIIFQVDLKGNYTFGNKAAERVTGYTLEELLRMNMRELAAPEYREMLFNRIARRIKKKPLSQPFEFEIIRKDGRRVWLELATAAQYSGDELVGVQGVARDVTERVFAERALQSAHKKLINAREQERRRLGRELHDSIGQRLTALHLSMKHIYDLAGENIDRYAADELNRIIKDCRSLMSEVRNVSHGLYPTTLETIGVASSLRQLADDYASMVDVTVEVKGASEGLFDKRLSANAKIVMFRIAQEAITNAVRHGKARKIQLSLIRQKNDAILIVVNDGEPYDPNADVGDGIGIDTMMRRAETVGGEFSINAEGGKTTVRVTIPLSPSDRQKDKT